MQMSVDDALDRMVQAWDAGDAAAYADLFTEDATYAMYAGLVSSGRDQIRRDHEPVLTEGGTGTRRRIPLDKVQTFTFRRQPDGELLCAAFQNTEKQRLLVWAHSRSTR